MKTNFKDFKKGLETIFPEKEKEIIGAVVSIAYDDGTFDRAAMLPEAEDDFNLNLIDDILKEATTALMACHNELPSALKKVADLIA